MEGLTDIAKIKTVIDKQKIQLITGWRWLTSDKFKVFQGVFARTDQTLLQIWMKGFSDVWKPEPIADSLNIKGLIWK